MKRAFAFGIAATLLAATGPIAAATFTVTSTADSGAGSLRQAITDANGAADADTIAFNIAGAGVHTIVLGSALPFVTDVATIDGYTQPGSAANTAALTEGTNAVLNVEVSGAAVAAEPCLTWAASGGRIQGLVVNRCPIGEIHVTGSVTIAGNFLGTTPQGGPLTDGSRHNRGIYALGAQTEPATTDVVVGGPNPEDRNIISGHTAVGLSEGIRGQFYTRLKVQGNLIGVDASASYTIANGIGIFSGATPPPEIGGPGANEGNVIAGSLANGMFGSASVFQGNFVGTNAAETAALGNLGGGYVGGGVPNGVVGGLGAGEGNVFAWNGRSDPGAYAAGLQILGGKTAIRGNRFYGNRPVAIALGFNPPNAADPTDADTGPNGLQNAPVLTGIDYGPPTVAHFVLSSAPSTTFDVDLYANMICDALPAGYAEGEELVGGTQITTDATGVATIDFPLPTPLVPGQGASALATDPLGNTSEFSQTILLTTSPRSGPAAGGGPVTLSGQLFEGGATVSVGGVAPSNVVVTPPYSITANMPVFPAGYRPRRRRHESGRHLGHSPERLHRGLYRRAGRQPVSRRRRQARLERGDGRNRRRPLRRGRFGEAAVDGRLRFEGRARHLLHPAAVHASGRLRRRAVPVAVCRLDRGHVGRRDHGRVRRRPTSRADLVLPRQTRAPRSMAPFLLKAVHGPAYVPPRCSGVFTDVSCPSLFADWIEQLRPRTSRPAAAGSVYCPANPNTRGQMATFLVKALRLP